MIKARSTFFSQAVRQLSAILFFAVFAQAQDSTQVLDSIQKIQAPQIPDTAVQIPDSIAQQSQEPIAQAQETLES